MSLLTRLPIVFFLIICAIAVTSCAYPTSSLRQGGQRPAIGFSGAPPNAVVTVDGVEMGPASQYNSGKQVLIVESGSHTVSLRLDGDEIYQQHIYLGSGETKIIEINK